MEHVQGIVGIGTVDGNALLNGVDFPPQALAGQARPPAGHHFRLTVQKYRGHGGGGGGVANAHFPGAQQAYALGTQVTGHLHPHQDGPFRLLPGHSGALGQVGGAPADVLLQDPFPVERGGHADIHRHDLHPGSPAHGAHAGIAGGHILRHNGGDLLAGLGDAVGHHAIVGAHHHHRPLGDVHVGAAGDGGNADNGALQSPQAAQGLGDGVPAGFGLVRRVLVGGGDGTDHFFQCHSNASCRRRAAATKLRAISGRAQKWKWGNPAYRVGVWIPQSQPRSLSGFLARKLSPGCWLSQ